MATGTQLKNKQENDAQFFLMAEDNPVDAKIFSNMLNQAFGASYKVVCVDRFEKIASALGQSHFQALILDLNLPDRSGIESLYQIGQEFPGLPIVVLTGNEDFELAMNSLHSGAQDYLSKNKVTPESLARSVHYAKQRKQIEQELKQALEEAAFKNVQLEAQTKHDQLTGLANRSYFQDVAKRILLRAERNKTKVALLYFDLNEFKKVNDTYGHLVGDELMKKVAVRLSHVVRDSDFLARMCGDEFVVITDTITDKKEVYPLVKRIQNQFRSDFHVGLHQISVEPSIGVAFFPEADNLDLLIKQADCAMNQAKANPASSLCFYSDQIAVQFARAQEIESYLGKALEKNELIATFQPIVKANGDMEIHLEALARWTSDRLGMITPDEFIPIAENTPAINGITQMITRHTQAFFLSADKMGLQTQRVSINVSAHQLANDHFYVTFLHWLQMYQLPPHCICLELTERQVIQNMSACKVQFNILRRRGIQIALDDFGTGFSSVTHLLDLPFDILKLDRILINHLDTNDRNQALVAGIVEMAHRLQMTVVAEGIEREEEKQKAIQLGCDYLQGYLFAKPLSIDDTLDFYEQRIE